MLDVGAELVPGAIAGPPGAGDGGGSSGNAPTGPAANVIAATLIPAAANAALALREIFTMVYSSERSIVDSRRSATAVEAMPDLPSVRCVGAEVRIPKFKAITTYGAGKRVPLSYGEYRRIGYGYFWWIRCGRHTAARSQGCLRHLAGFHPRNARTSSTFRLGCPVLELRDPAEPQELPGPGPMERR
jgi:hypothetical protein